MIQTEGKAIFALDEFCMRSSKTFRLLTLDRLVGGEGPGKTTET